MFMHILSLIKHSNMPVNPRFDRESVKCRHSLLSWRHLAAGTSHAPVLEPGATRALLGLLLVPKASQPKRNECFCGTRSLRLFCMAALNQYDEMKASPINTDGRLAWLVVLKPALKSYNYSLNNILLELLIAFIPNYTILY